MIESENKDGGKAAPGARISETIDAMSKVYKVSMILSQLSDKLVSAVYGSEEGSPPSLGHWLLRGRGRAVRYFLALCVLITISQITILTLEVQLPTPMVSEARVETASPEENNGSSDRFARFSETIGAAEPTRRQKKAV